MSNKWQPDDEDDDDAIMQAALLASMGSWSPDDEAPAVDEQTALLKKFVPPPLVGPPVSLDGLADSLTDVTDATRASLRQLEEGSSHLRLLRIRGDGHCMFRAVAASLVLQAAWGGREGLSSLHSHCDRVAAECATGVVAALRELIGPSPEASGAQRGLGGGSMAALEALNDSTISDAAVAALRAASGKYMSIHLDRFAHVGAATDTDADATSTEADTDADINRLNEYIHRMAAMSEAPAYGGHPELVALSELLQLRCVVIELRADTLTTITLADHLEGSDAPTVHLVRLGLHYHLLLPASPIGERISNDSLANLA